MTTNTTNKYIPFALTLHGHTPDPPQPTKWRFVLNNNTYRLTALIHALDAAGYNKATRWLEDIYAYTTEGWEVLKMRYDDGKLSYKYVSPDPTIPIPIGRAGMPVSMFKSHFSILSFLIPDSMVEALKEAYPENIIPEES